MSVWYSVEVIAAELPAMTWAESWSDALVGSALRSGATDWSWHAHSWGIVFEVEFCDESAWEAYRLLPTVQAALEAVPDPLTGLIVYRGRGGSYGAGQPRTPKPLIGSGAAALPIPWDEPDFMSDLTDLLGPAQPLQAAAPLI